MMNVITSEFYKILKSKVFYTISIILLVFNAIFAALNIYAFNNPAIKNKIELSGFIGYQQGFSTDFTCIIILIFVVCLITNEYTNKTIRQMCCHGISRIKLMLGQYIAISSIITLVLIIFGIINFVSSSIISEVGQVDLNAFIYMNLGFICLIWGLSAIGILFAYVFRGQGVSLILSVVFFTCSNIVLQILYNITKSKIWIEYSFTNMRSNIVNYSSAPLAIFKYSMVFILISIVCISLSTLVFAKRDID